MTDLSFEPTNQGSFTVVEPIITTATLTSDLQTSQSQSSPPLENTHAAAAQFDHRPPIMVRQYEDTQPGEVSQGGNVRMNVDLPSVRKVEEEEEEEEDKLLSAADNESSTNDVF
ncbi:hypothetical protein LDENG_00256080 [Lucifuga dentata]|nr:hypothetical protein LDENG_00256080 [Lucifuga dentata]